MKEIKLSNKVFSKDFKTKAVGYDVREVDSFFDEVNIEIAKLEREIENLNQKLQIAEAEKKVQLACKERDAAKKVMEV